MFVKSNQPREYARKGADDERREDADKKLNDTALALKKKTEEVVELGKQFVAGQAENLELKAKVDEALADQGSLRQEIKEMQQVISEAGEKAKAEPQNVLESAMQKHFEENPDDMKLLRNPVRGKTVNIPMSRKALLGSTATGGVLNYPGMQLPMVGALVRRLTVRDLMPQGRTDKPVVFYPREVSASGGPTIVAEGAAKPEWNFVMENITAAVPTIAHWTQISLQMLDDVPFLRSYIEGRMLYQLKLVEEDQFLNGSGAGGNMEGLVTAATPYAEPAGVAVTNETPIDRLRLMMLQIELAYAYATGVVLDPVSWANIELQKTTQNQYLFTNPQGTATGRIWGRDVVSTQAMTAGEALVGDFSTHAQVLDRQDANVAISFEDRDNFIKNLATIRVEERSLVLVYRPQAFVTGPLVDAG
jgi:HK97 family phage major capsid protein